MKCEKVNEYIMDYICGNLDSETRSCIDSHVAECAGCKQLYEEMKAVWSMLEHIPQEEPTPALRTQFYSMLKAYRHGLNDVPVRSSSNEKPGKWLERWWPRRPVFQFGIAALFLICGIGIGQKMSSVVRTNGDMAQLKGEVHELHQMVTLSLLNQSSAIERLQGLTMSRSIKNPDEEFLSLLLLTLNSDPNVNVRLAAVTTLYTFCDNPWVSSELVKSLTLQTSPLVQISLIDLLAEIQEPKAFEVLRAISDDDRTIEAVKNRARWGINQII